MAPGEPTPFVQLPEIRRPNAHLGTLNIVLMERVVRSDLLGRDIDPVIKP
jgi:hypothetical protein